MTGYLLDTNIISEVMKPTADINVVQFLSRVQNSFLSVITLHELSYGLSLLPQGQRQDKLTQHLNNLLFEYNDVILPITSNEAQQAALLRTKAKQQGRNLHLADSLIAATAQCHQLTIATRNVKDFADLSILIINPWHL